MEYIAGTVFSNHSVVCLSLVSLIFVCTNFPISHWNKVIHLLFYLFDLQLIFIIDFGTINPFIFGYSFLQFVYFYIVFNWLPYSTTWLQKTSLETTLFFLPSTIPTSATLQLPFAFYPFVSLLHMNLLIICNLTHVVNLIKLNFFLFFFLFIFIFYYFYFFLV